MSQLMGAIEKIEDYTDIFDELRAENDRVESLPAGTDSFEERYRSLREQYIKRFGELNGEQINNDIPDDVENEGYMDDDLPDLEDLDFNASTE